MKSLHSLQLHVEKRCSQTVGLFAPAVVHRVVTLAHPCCERLHLSGMLLLHPIMTLTCFQFTCSPVECSKQCFLSTPQPSQSVAPVPAFLEHVAGIKLKMSEYWQKTTKLISLNIKYLVHVVYSIEYRLKRICKSLYSVFIYVLHNVPTSLELGL